MEKMVDRGHRLITHHYCAETAAIARSLCRVTVSTRVEFFGNSLTLSAGASRMFERNGPSVAHRNQGKLAQYALYRYHIDKGNLWIEHIHYQ